jgi:ribosomal-protein-alanine N-acetyltransferase
MRSDDIEQVAAIEGAVTSAPWTNRQFQQSLEQHQCVVICQRNADDNVVLGYMILASVFDQTELLNIAIDPQHQGHGLGSQMLNSGLQSLADRIESVLLEVRVSNYAAIRLYLNYGFIEVGRRRDYYKTTFGREDAILMTLQRTAVKTRN